MSGSRAITIALANIGVFYLCRKPARNYFPPLMAAAISPVALRVSIMAIVTIAALASRFDRVKIFKMFVIVNIFYYFCTR